MDFNKNILIELETLSPLLASLPKNNIFSVPTGYFDTLTDTVLIGINEPSNHVVSISEMDIPLGYFDTLSSSILDKIKLQQQHTISELESISPIVYSIKPANSFEVPTGYFDTLAFFILDKINLQQKHAVSELEGISKIICNTKPSITFEVPQGYFESLPSAILGIVKENNVSLAANEISFLFPAKPVNIFQVPEEYFEQLPSIIIDRLNYISNNVEDDFSPNFSPNLLKTIATNVFEVPVGYFNNLSSNIVAAINKEQIINATDEIKALSPLLHGIQHTNVFEVPQGYFNNLSPQLLQSVKPVAAKVVSIRKFNLFVRLAAAAVFIGAISIVIFKHTSSQPLNNTVAKIELAKTTVAPTKVDSALVKGSFMNDDEFDSAMNNLSTDEISKYLEKNNSEEDMASLTSNVDENIVPDKNDYLLDEQVLEKYLDEIKKEN